MNQDDSFPFQIKVMQVNWQDYAFSQLDHLVQTYREQKCLRAAEMQHVECNWMLMQFAPSYSNQ